MLNLDITSNALSYFWQLKQYDDTKNHRFLVVKICKITDS